MFLSIREPMFVPFLECMFFSGSTNPEHQQARLMAVIPELKSCTIMKYFPLEILGSVLWGLNFSLWLKKQQQQQQQQQLQLSSTVPIDMHSCKTLEKRSSLVQAVRMLKSMAINILFATILLRPWELILKNFVDYTASIENLCFNTKMCTNMVKKLLFKLLFTSAWVVFMMARIASIFIS